MMRSGKDIFDFTDIFFLKKEVSRTSRKDVYTMRRFSCQAWWCTPLLQQKAEREDL